MASGVVRGFEEGGRDMTERRERRRRPEAEHARAIPVRRRERLLTLRTWFQSWLPSQFMARVSPWANSREAATAAASHTLGASNSPAALFPTALAIAGASAPLTGPS